MLSGENKRLQKQPTGLMKAKLYRSNGREKWKKNHEKKVEKLSSLLSFYEQNQSSRNGPFADSLGKLC